MSDSSDILTGLNPEQKKAVEHFEGPLLILAGAGSGKTRVLTHRIAYLIENYGVNPLQILAVTFTNKAAGEMKERVDNLLGGMAGDLWVSTFHSLCARILRKEIGKIGYDNNFVIFDTDDQQKLISRILKELNLDPKKTRPRAILSEISRAKNELIDPRSYANNVGDYFQDITARIYPLYQERLKESNALDFDDLIMKTIEVFVDNPMVLEYYQERFKYILVDEYQDVNFAQYKLVQLLANKYRNLCVVGDPDQGIYGFRGADIRNILNFEEDYPEARVIKLEQNYRSKEKILKAAHHVIRNNTARKEKRLWTKRGKGEDLKLYVAFDDKDEASYVCRKIKELKREKNYKFSDFAVLYRTNSQSRSVEEMMVKYAIPYQIVGGFRFYDRMEIKDILAYLRVIYNPSDEVSLLRIINRPKRGIGQGTISKLSRYARERGISLYKAGTEAESNPYLTASFKKRVKAFFDLLEELREKSETLSIDTLTHQVVTRTGYQRELNEEGTQQARNRLENIQELFSVIEEFMKGNENKTLGAFLEEVSLISDVDNMEDNQNVVTLMTLHSAKGLEFPVVFIIGMEEGLFPHANSMMDHEELEEERRLCYVGITRARDELYLTRARERMRFGQRKPYPPSRFLDEIPPQLFEDNNDKKEEILGNIKEKESKTGEYKVGDTVVHPRWGKGQIVGVRENRGLELKINFGKGKVKTLLAEYAPIQKA
nr:DNA helicase PcrA [Halothermothrix orenii]